jgi:hypothetical protein
METMYYIGLDGPKLECAGWDEPLRWHSIPWVIGLTWQSRLICT